MKRKTKITISIVASLIILLGLLGLTYGYYMTRINGNTNSEKSVLISAARLQLDYGEETSTVKSYSNLAPGSVAATKYFTAKNSGNTTVTYSAILDSIESSFKRSEDLTYTLTCTSYNSSGFAINSSGGVTSGTVNGSCSGVSGVRFPLGEMGIMVSNTIPAGRIHYYKLTVNYLSKGVDQSVDMGASFSAKVNIIEPDSLNPYRNDKKTLAYNIINNALIKKDGKTEFLTSPVTIPAQETSERYMALEDGSGSIDIEAAYQNYYWTYAQGYEIDPYTGKFNLTKVKTCKYNDGSCHRTLKNKYIVSTTVSANSSNSNTTKTTTNLPYVYRVVEAPEATGSKISMRYIRVSPSKYNAENTLTSAPDDLGTSYYYRGDVDNNYLELNGLCFRIVRIQGDGSIKITLANNGPCSGSTTSSGLINNGSTNYVYGYDTDNSTYWKFNYEGYTGNDGLYKNLSNWFDSKFKDENGELTNIGKKLKNETWCLGGKSEKFNYNTGVSLGTLTTNSQYWYETGIRLWGPYNSGYNHTTRSATYRCINEEGSKMDSYIGTLTADEAVFAGGATYDNSVANSNGNKTYYLYDNAQTYYWTLSRSDFRNRYDDAFYVGSDGSVNDDFGVNYSRAVRPAVTIVTGAELLSGDGTIGSPYTIK